MPQRLGLRIEDHEQDVWLHLIARLNERLRAMAHHEAGEEDVYCFHDRAWNDLRSCIVPVEVQRRKDRHQDGVEEATTVGECNLPKALKHRGAELEGDLLHADVSLEQMVDDRLDAP